MDIGTRGEVRETPDQPRGRDPTFQAIGWPGVPIPRAGDAIVVGNVERPSYRAAASCSIVTDSGELLYGIRSRAAEIWPTACNALARPGFALVDVALPWQRCDRRTIHSVSNSRPQGGLGRQLGRFRLSSRHAHDPFRARSAAGSNI